MHLFFLSRGEIWHQRRFIDSLNNMWMPMKIGDNKIPIKALLQPIQLYSLVFPEENLHNVLRTIRPDNQIGIDSSSPSPARKLPLDILRRGLGLKKIPKWDPNGNKYPLYKEHVQVVGIGIKKDYKDENGNECL